jgi:hypothetical protein
MLRRPFQKIAERRCDTLSFSFPNSVWERTPANSVCGLLRDHHETEFRSERSQTEFGNEVWWNEVWIEFGSEVWTEFGNEVW